MRLLMVAWLALLAVSLAAAAAGAQPSASAGSKPAAAAAGSQPERERALRQVESSLLSLFGFGRRPRVDRSKVVVPQHMLDLYRRHSGEEVDSASIRRVGINSKTANTVRSFTHVESPVDAKFAGHHKFRLFFEVDTVPKHEKLKAAEVTLTRETISKLSKDQILGKDHLQHILVHDIVKPGIRGKHEAILRLIDSKMVDIRQNKSVNLDVLPAVERWLESEKNNHGIVIQIIGYGKQKPKRHLRLRRSTESSAEWSTRQPLLFTYTDDGKNVQRSAEDMSQRRARRASMKKHKRKDGRELCRRHIMYVDFTDVGWNDWIVAPPGYEAYYCHGDCNFPLADHMNSTNHAIVQTLVNSMTPSVVPKACCVPTSLTSISMLYLDEENKVVLKNYQDMSVLGCGCR